MFDIKTSFGKNLKIIRKSKNITQEKLAEMIDIHPRQLSKIETGEHFPSANTLGKICLALGVLPKELFDFEYEKIVCFRTNSSSESNIISMLEKFKKIAYSDNYTKFVELAIEAVYSKKSLNKLQDMIDGIKLGQNI